MGRWIIGREYGPAIRDGKTVAHGGMVGGQSINDVVDSYYRFLARNNYAGHLKRFKDRLDSDKSAAEAEAAVFMMLRNEKLNPDVNEHLETGGPDFLCSPQLVSHF